MATFSYNGTHTNVPAAPSGTTYTFNSGLFLCSIQPTGTAPYYTPSSNQSNGVLLQYGQTKEVEMAYDATAAVFMNRPKPVIQYGTYNFLTLSCTYSIPPAGVALGGSGYKPGNGFDANQTIEQAMTALRDGQMGIGTTAGATYLAQIQDIRGRSSGASAPGLIGMIYSLKFEDLVNPSGWQKVSFMFCEVGVS